MCRAVGLLYSGTQQICIFVFLLKKIVDPTLCSCIFINIVRSGKCTVFFFHYRPECYHKMKFLTMKERYSVFIQLLY